MNGDDVLKLRRARLANALGGHQHVGMGRAICVEERLLVEARRLDHQRIALKMANGMTVVEGEGDQLLKRGQRFVHRDRADLVVQFVNDGDLPGRSLDDLERVGIGEHPGDAVRNAEFARCIGDGPVLKSRLVHLLRRTARGRERQGATANELKAGIVLGYPVRAGNVGRRARGNSHRTADHRSHQQSR